MSMKQNDDKLWEDFCEAENAFYEKRMALLKDVKNLDTIIGTALDKPFQRGTALRLLEILPEEISRRHLGQLVSLASVGQSDIDLCRKVLSRIDRNWLVEHIESYVLPILENGGEEEFRRIAELYNMLSKDLLDKHLQRCAGHVDDEVREIAADFVTAQQE